MSIKIFSFVCTILFQFFVGGGGGRDHYFSDYETWVRKA